MELNNDESSNIEDRRGEGGGFGGGGFGGGGFGGGGMGGIPIGGGLFKGGFGLLAIVVIGMILGVNPLSLLGGATTVPRAPRTSQTQTRTASRPSANADPETQFVARVLKSTEDIWGELFQANGPAISPAAPGALSATRPRPPAARASRRWGRSTVRPTSASTSISRSSTRWPPVPRARPVPAGLCDRPRGRPPHPEPAGHLEQGRGDAPEHAASATPTPCRCGSSCRPTAWRACGPIMPDRERGGTATISEKDVDQALAAATAIGDDRLQRQSQGRIVPNSFTHGSSAQRVRWFKKGLESGDHEGLRYVQGAAAVAARRSPRRR